MDAFLVHLEDRAQQKHIQRNPFLLGELALSKELRDTWVHHFEIRRPEKTPYSQQVINRPLNNLVSDEDRAAIVETCASVGLDEAAAFSMITTWGWKIAQAPRHAKRILSIGSSTGTEMLLLRALFPHAELQGVDYDLSIPAKWRATLKFGDLREQHLEEYLAARPKSFDLIFSNHTLEHLSTPDQTLRLVRAALKTGGTLVSALPLEGDTSNPFHSDLLAIAEGRREFDPQFDIEFLTPSHAWKTNREDLAATLSASGFTDIQIIARANFPSNNSSLHVSQFRRQRSVGKLLERVTLQAIRRSLRIAYPGEVPYQVARVYYALANRCWFSRMRMLLNLTHEVVFVATTTDD